MDWTKAEDRILIGKLRKGIRLETVEIDSRTYQAKYARLKKLRRKGLKLWLGKRPWARREHRELFKQIREGKQPIEINIKGRTLEAVRKEINRLHLAGKLKVYFRKPGIHVIWSGQEKRILRSLASKLATSEGIYATGKLPGRTELAIEAQLKSLGLLKIDEEHSARLKSAKRMTRSDRAVLRAYLEGLGRTLPNEVIGQTFGIHPDRVSYYRRVWRIPLVHAEAMDNPIYRARYEANKVKRVKAMKEALYIQPRRTSGKLTEQLRTDASNRCPHELVPCVRCKKRWFFNRSYFHSLNGGNGEMQLLQTCLACKVRKPKA